MGSDHVEAGSDMGVDLQWKELWLTMFGHIICESHIAKSLVNMEY